MKILILKGLPASGKSTFANQLVLDDPIWVRINKDAIRLELIACTCGHMFHEHGDRGEHCNLCGCTVFKSAWTQKLENSIVRSRDERIIAALQAGKNVIVDDTNLAAKHESVIRDIAQTCNAVVEVNDSFLDVPVETCIARDAARTGVAHVGEAVIRRMHSQHISVATEPPIQPYAHQDDLPWCVISDLDGTLAFHEGVRDVYDGSRCHLDKLNHPVATIISRFCECQSSFGMPDHIIYVSGRDDCWEPQTRKFLATHQLPTGSLFMRKTGDKRNDAIVKQELFDAHIRGRYNVRFVLDDRDRVVKYWRAIGLACLQVNYGNF